MKKHLKWMICILSLIIFLLLTYLVITKKDLRIDSIVYNFISQFINDNLTKIVKFITFLGSATIVILVTLVALITLKNKKIGLFMGIDLIVITLFQHILKPLIGRVRPVGINLVKESSLSFPSGHSLTAMAFYGYIIYLLYKSNLKYKKIYIILLGILILLIGLSRIYLGAHYVTDVLGGFTFSLFYLVIFIELAKKRTF